MQKYLKVNRICHHTKRTSCATTERFSVNDFIVSCQKTNQLGSIDAKSSVCKFAVSERVLTLDPELFPSLKNFTNLTWLSPEDGAFGISPLIAGAVIRCYGWQVDTSIFDLNSPLKKVHRMKYPDIFDTYQAVDIPGLYFAGSSAHSLDYRKSAGGFIHGFRYSVRALFRHLMESRYGVPWPSDTYDLSTKQGRSSFLAKFLHRWANTAGPYHMFGGTLLDGAVFKRELKGKQLTCLKPVNDPNCVEKHSITAEYFEEMPSSLMFEKCTNHTCLIWYFRHGRDFKGPGVLESTQFTTHDRENARTSFFYPKVEVFRATEGGETTEIRKVFATRGDPDFEFMGAESQTFRFNSFRDHKEPFRRFVARVLKLNISEF